MPKIFIIFAKSGHTVWELSVFHASNSLKSLSTISAEKSHFNYPKSKATDLPTRQVSKTTYLNGKLHVAPIVACHAAGETVLNYYQQEVPKNKESNESRLFWRHHVSLSTLK